MLSQHIKEEIPLEREFDKIKKNLEELGKCDIEKCGVCNVVKQGLSDNFEENKQDLIKKTIKDIQKKVGKQRRDLYLQVLEEINKLKELLIIDPLTGCYNGFYLSQVVDSLFGKVDFGYIFIDMNGLKELNDIYGHDKGDEALKLTASTLKKVFDLPNCLVFRRSGDEFIVIVGTDVSNETEISAIAEKVKEFLDKEKKDKKEKTLTYFLVEQLKKKTDNLSKDEIINILKTEGVGILKEAIKKTVDMIKNLKVDVPLDRDLNDRRIQSDYTQVNFATGLVFSSDFGSIADMIITADEEMQNHKASSKNYDIRKLPEENKKLKEENKKLKEKVENLRALIEGRSKESETKGVKPTKYIFFE